MDLTTMPSALLSQILRTQDLRQKQVVIRHRGRSQNISTSFYMRRTARFLAILVLILQSNQIHAQPIKASDDLIYPVNPPRPVHPSIAAPGNQSIVAPSISASATASTKTQPFKNQDGFTSTIVQGAQTQTSNPTYSVSFDSDRSGTIASADIRIHALVYSKNAAGDVHLLESKLSPEWSTMPVDFREPELLSIKVPTEGDPTYGVVFGLYHKGKLMTCVSEPESLLEQFPLPVKE